MTEDNLSVSITPAGKKYSFPLRKASSVGQFLNMPPLPSELPAKPKSHGRVLTSQENRLFMEENEKKKQMEAMKKKEKKRMRASKKTTVKQKNQVHILALHARLSLGCIEYKKRQSLVHFDHVLDVVEHG